MPEHTFTIEASDGQLIACRSWPVDDARAVVQIAHGASEHCLRYARLATALNDAGYAVVANDHRGHGVTAAEHGTFGVARPGGWSAMLTDLHTITDHARTRHPDTPLILFGHSMGSMLAQGYIQRWGDDLAGVVLSGSTGGSVIDDDTLAAVVGLGEGDGADEPSAVFAAMFDGFNEPFGGPEATGFEWLSRDPAEVAAYVADPWCGAPLSNGFVADMMTGTTAMWQPDAEARIPTSLPVYIFSGQDDPVGGQNADSVRALADRYEALGIGPLTVEIYENGRHEMLNETNRDQVTADLISWLDRVTDG